MLLTIIKFLGRYLLFRIRRFFSKEDKVEMAIIGAIRNTNWIHHATHNLPKTTTVWMDSYGNFIAWNIRNPKMLIDASKVKQLSGI